MKIVKPWTKIVGEVDGVALLKAIESAARISHRSEDDQKEESYLRFCQNVIVDRGDWSVVEHANISVDFYVDRGITHEIVRHRHFGFTQESTRFVNYEKKMPPSFIYPQVDIECAHCLAGNQPHHFGNDWLHKIGGRDYSCVYEYYWLSAIAQDEASYKALLAKKWAPQDARSVLPNALGSLIRISGNLRAWRWMMLMRTTKQTHPQYRQVTIPLLAQFKEMIPILFDDIIPLETQAVASRKSH